MKPKKSQQRGASLIIVLASLVFLAALVVAFLASVSTELRSSKAYSAGANAKLLSQSAVNLALAQISAATAGTNGTGTVAWASQPGMIRTYDTSGAAANYYKLYSWTDMSGSGAYDPTLATNAVPANWDSQKALYVDLNQPQRIPDGSTNKLIYPIVDGNGLTSYSSTYITNAKTYVTNSAPAVDGFYVTGDVPVASGSTANPVPMPVKWLYVLENGKVVAPDSTGVATQATVNGAASDNQIVGRIAFWTDDETSKVNINTAADGTYADMPRGSLNTTEGNLAKNQPVQGEYQRYPGHPAMTSLTTVLKKPAGLADATWSESIYDIVPRVKTGGSLEGSTLTTKSAAGTIPAITPDPDRLYGSVDELAFKPTSTSGQRDLNNSAVLNKETLSRDRFFLTAFSRAPDVNLFNKPRVLIWPIFDHTSLLDSHLTAFDRLMAFCGTINNSIYYFQRKDPLSTTTDLPLTGGNTGVSRNRMLMEYLRSLASSNIPGFGGNFKAKYGSDSDQILTEIFDYIRCTNLADSSLADASMRYTVAHSPTSNSSPGLGQVLPIVDSVNGTRGFGRFRTVQGAYLLFSACADGDAADGQKDSVGADLAAASKVQAGYVRIQALFLLQMFDPNLGSVFNNPYFRWKVTGLENFKWGPAGGSLTTMGFAGASSTYQQDRYPVDGAFYGDQFGINQMLNVTWTTNYLSTTIDLPKNPDGTFTVQGGTITINLYPLSSTVPFQTVSFTLPGGTFPLPAIGPLSVTTRDTQVAVADRITYMRYLKNRIYHGTDRDIGGAWLIDKNGGDASNGYDIIRGVGPTSGDVRLIAARSDITDADGLYSQINPSLWSSGAVMGMHTLRSGSGEPLYGAYMGSLVPNLTYESAVQAGGYNKNSSNTDGNGRNYLNIPTSAGADVTFNGVAVGRSVAWQTGDLVGDFDNAPEILRDGPFINRADEGSQGGATTDPYDWGRGLQLTYLKSPTLFTPNRLVPSAVTFGSLSTGVLAKLPWQTLLFHYDPTGKHPGNPGKKQDGSSSPNMPGDHLLLDFYTMPVVEPYAISEPLSTAGRINMNYQMIPFTYINRDTGIRSVLKNEKVIAIKDSDVSVYKRKSNTTMSDIRLDIDADETLKGFSQRFNNKDIFRSASEICTLPLVPVGQTYSGMSAFWDSYRLTGDNSKERPYATIYPRLTTKSNTFTIHYRVQALKKIKGSNVTVWDEATDKVIGEFRGLQTVERYVDPNNQDIPDYANVSANPNPTPLGSFYKFRVLQSKQFSP